ncbi:MAG: PAS domain S-box protein, partial [Nitrospira sp.]|nr:PAS domain S-box protein [Nitrospira sp.]
MSSPPLHPVPSENPLPDRVLSSLDIAVFERNGMTGEFHLQGRAPEWWCARCGSEPRTVLDLDLWSPFLKDYLIADDPARNAEASVVEKSGPWTETDGQGATMTFEATVLCIESRTILLVECLGTGFEQMRAIVQRARERVLAETIASKTQRKTETRLINQLEASERTKDDALALLQHLGLAALVLDERGRITFASDHGLELLGFSAEEAIGREWEEVFLIEEQDRVMLRELIEAPPNGRIVGPLCMRKPNPSWVELGIHHDPRHPDRRILVVTDRTELHTLRRVLNEQSSFHDLVGKSPAMLRVYQLVRDVASVDTTVLIEGETG